MLSEGDTSKDRESPEPPRQASDGNGSASRAEQQCLHKVCFVLSSMTLATEVAVAHSVQQQQQPGGDAAVADTNKHLLRVPWELDTLSLLTEDASLDILALRCMLANPGSL
jgi:hypothetical protein